MASATEFAGIGAVGKGGEVGGVAGGGKGAGARAPPTAAPYRSEAVYHHWLGELGEEDGRRAENQQL